MSGTRMKTQILLVLTTVGFAAPQHMIYPFVLSQDYSNKVSPPGKTLVRVGHVIRDISEVSDSDYSITLILEFMMAWNDTRITVNQTIFKDFHDKG